MEKLDKKSPPPYVTYKSFSNFINGLRETGMPTHLTRSMLPGSNSGKATMSASLRALGLINGEDEPKPLMNRLTDPTESYGKVLNEMLFSTYDFLSDPAFDIKNTTTEKVVEKFKAAGAQGSTITKCMAFLLPACQDAEIEVSRYVKPPPPLRGSFASKKKPKLPQNEIEHPLPADKGETIPDGMERIVVSLRNMEDGIIFLPEGLTQEESKRAVKAVEFNLKHYYELDD